MEVSIVAVMMEDLDSMFCCILLKGKLGGDCFGRLVVELEVDKMEAAIVVNEDGGTLIVLLGKFAFELCKNPTSVDVIWSTKMHSLGLVVTKTSWSALVSLPYQGSLVITPNRQPAHLGGSTLASFFGILPLRASCLSFGKVR